MNSLINGPYVRAIGAISRPELSVVSAAVPGDPVPAPVTFGEDGSVTSVSSLTREDITQPLPQPVLKASGVARARNAAKSTIFAALLAKDFLGYINELPDFDPDRVVIGICNCSSSAAISWEFETEGVSLGWERSNTMLMPSSLPSAICTQVSAAIKTHAAAITFLDDIMGVASAVEYSYTSFFHERADHAFIIAAEEWSIPHDMVLGHFGKPLPEARDGAAGLLLSRNKPEGDAWQLCLCSHLADGAKASLPAELADARVLPLTLDNEAILTSLLLPYAVNHLLATTTSGKAVLNVTVPGRGVFVLGFQQRAN